MKKRLFAVISVLLLLTLFVQSTFAAEPRAQAGFCPNCGQTMTKVSSTRTYEHDESFPCTHHPNGKDYYKVYEIVIKWHCGSCGYNLNSTTEDHVFDHCSGY